MRDFTGPLKIDPNSLNCRDPRRALRKANFFNAKLGTITKRNLKKRRSLDPKHVLLNKSIRVLSSYKKDLNNGKQ